jgi:CRP-like cAMP-binding protein
MAFLDSFDPSHRAQIEEAATPVRLAKGEYLMRRGEPGGDVYVLRSGKLEIVDTRSTPEVIFSTLGQGAVVGEMSFVDDSPRSADVRAGSDAEVLRWTREDLRAYLGQRPALAAEFYRQVAKLASQRMRNLAEGAMSGAFGAEQSGEADEVRRWVDDLVNPVKSAMPGVETALRRDPNDRVAMARARELLDQVEVECHRLFEAVRDPASGQLASDLLARELHPYLVRSSLAERCIRRAQGSASTQEILSLVFADQPHGEGRLGDLADRWVLDRPTFKAIRSIAGPLTEQVVRHLPRHRNRRVLLLDGCNPGLVGRLCQELSQPPTVLTVMDQSREILSSLESARAALPKSCELRCLQESPARFSVGRSRVELPRQDAVVLQGLVEFLPERLAVSLLNVAAKMISEDGFIALATLGPSRDRVLLDRLLGWPTLRRNAGAVTRMLAAAGLKPALQSATSPPGLVVIASRESAG